MARWRFSSGQCTPVSVRATNWYCFFNSHLVALSTDDPSFRATKRLPGPPPAHRFSLAGLFLREERRDRGRDLCGGFSEEERLRTILALVFWAGRLPLVFRW